MTVNPFDRVNIFNWTSINLISFKAVKYLHVPHFSFTILKKYFTILFDSSIYVHYFLFIQK